MLVSTKTRSIWMQLLTVLTLYAIEVQSCGSKSSDGTHVQIIRPSGNDKLDNNLDRTWSMERLFRVAFPGRPGDGIKLQWTHAANTRSVLLQSLNTPQPVVLLEIDVSIDNENRVVLQHDPSAIVDTSFDQLITIIAQNDTPSTSKSIGLKLDFKSMAAASLSLPLLKQAQQDGRLQHVVMVWLNADVVSVAGAPVMDAQTFITLCTQQLPGVPLSLGWRVNPQIMQALAQPRPDSDQREALQQMNTTLWKAVTDMDQVIQLYVPTGTHVTFPIRAGMLGLTMKQTVWLFRQNPADRSLTLWHDASDQITDNYIAAVTALRSQVPVDKVLYDIPEQAIQTIQNT